MMDKSETKKSKKKGMKKDDETMQQLSPRAKCIDKSVQTSKVKKADSFTQMVATIPDLSNDQVKKIIQKPDSPKTSFSKMMLERFDAANGMQNSLKEMKKNSQLEVSKPIISKEDLFKFK